MSLLSLIALLFGTAGVWLTIRQTIWCWPVSLVAVVASVAEFYHERLYGDMALQVFYFFAGVYGWIFWHQQRAADFKVRHMSSRVWPLLVAGTAFQAFIYYRIILYFNGDRPLLDAALTAASLTATFMMTRKWVQNWITWVVIDTTYIYLYAVKEMWLFAVLYLIFAALAFYGWRSWKLSSREGSSLFLVFCSLFWML